MFFPGTPNIFAPSAKVFMLLKCMCNNILIENIYIYIYIYIPFHLVIPFHLAISSF